MIQPKSRTIDDIFSDGQNRIVVPRYQRNFDWGKNEVQELMSDLEAAQKSDAGRLFLGTFVFDNSTEGELRVVDGQQRLTTISLVLLACRTVAKKNKQYDLAQEIQKKLTFTDSATGKKVSERVSASSSIADIFQYICDNDWNGEFPTRVDINGSIKPIKRQTNKVKPVYDFIHDQIKDHKPEDLSNFLRALYGSYVIEITIADELEAFDIFERTNARGLDLNVADLLKNYLFAAISDVDIEEKWNEIVENSENTLQRMLKYFWVSGHGYVQKKNLYRNLKMYGNELGAEKMTDELYKFSRYYKAIRSLEIALLREWFAETDLLILKENESYQGQLNRNFEALKLFQVSQVYPLIYSIFIAYKKAGADARMTKILLNLLQVLEKYHFVNNVICERIGNEIEQLYAESATEFYDTDDFKTTSDRLIKELKKRKASIDEFVPRFADLAYHSDTIPLIHYVYDRINNFDHKDSQWVSLYNPDKNLLKKNFNIEHFLPRNPDQPHEEEEVNVLDNIGNLLVISRHSNSSFGNLPPAEKIKLLSEPKHSGKLSYLKDFVQKYDVGENWDEKTIIQRAKDVADHAYKEYWSF